MRFEGFGKISAELARETAEREFEKFEHHRRELDDTQGADDFANEVQELQTKTREIGGSSNRSKDT